MKPGLSIIIPCYNCAATLREAVNSCYEQGFAPAEFEIVMVDDGSTDGTKELIQALAAEKSNIKAVFHDKNRGGGAARNTAVANTSADVIFCLDSDDMLPPHTLDKMLDFMKSKQADGVGVEKSVKFRNDDVNDVYRIDTFSYSGEKIPFEALLQRGGILCPLYSTFMHTKKAFNTIGGYPTTHGFDTQAFAWRFLASGFTAYTCPDTAYLHRLSKKPSYFAREYAAGKSNFNWLAIFEEFLYLFTPETKKKLADFPLSDRKDIFEQVMKKGDVLVSGYEKLLTPGASAKYLVSPGREKLPHRTLAPRPVTATEKTRNKIVAAGRILIKSNPALKQAVHEIHSRLGARYQWTLIAQWIGLGLRKLFWVDFKDIATAASDETIDIVIPTISKDFDLLKECLAGIRKNVLHPIGSIFIVSRDGQPIKDFCVQNGLIFVDELSILGYGKEKTPYVANGVDRSGWMFQQLLKLSGDTFVTAKRYLVVDSDTILIQQHSFLESGKTVFAQNSEWHEPYFRTFETLFGYEAPARLSLTSHMMLFTVADLKAMKAELERKHGKSWDKVYTGTANPAEASCVSDYDNYAGWVMYNHPKGFKTRPFYNVALPRTRFAPLDALEQAYATKHKSLSFHSYIQ